jgi:hypothetical protein
MIRVRSQFVISVVFLAALAVPDRMAAQSRGGAQSATAKAAAPIDVTGYWVAEVTEDWRWRMVTPAKGDWESVPLNADAQAIARNWDPAKDTAGGEQCKAYGAPALMRAPTRLHITWEDDSTIKVDADYGTQTRLLHFGAGKPAADTPPTWQGTSIARWEAPGGRGAVRAGSGAGSLIIATNHLKPGYLRKNGVPYSANTTLTEYWDLLKESNGDQRLLMLLQVDDPMYLTTPWIVAVHFKKERDGAKWDPSPCDASW